MFYTFYQNPVGVNSIIKNDEVAEFLIIESETYQLALDKAFGLTENNTNYCPCCGFSWDFSVDDEEDKNGYESPSVFGESIEKLSKYKTVIIHRLNGTIEKINY